MGGRAGGGVVIVVPAFAVGDDRHPPVVAALVGRFVILVAPDVAGGIHEPGGVQHKHQANEDPIDHERAAHVVAADEIAQAEQHRGECEL